jgi:UDP-3-O-[3-hydroxymyristoyl] glucosamine N-acyltransferase
VLEPKQGLALLVHPNPYLAYAKASELFAHRDNGQGISALACISEDAKIGEGVYIGPYTHVDSGAIISDGCYIDSGCYIGANAVIGSGCRLFSGVTIYHEVLIGSGCRIHSGTVIGSDGFGFAPSEQGWVKIHQLGGVVIGKGTDIGANVSISRGALDDTRIGEGVIIDDLVLIAHNVEIGDHTALAGQIGIAGSTKIGARCTMGGQVAVTGHIEIADDVHITGKSMVTRSILKAGQYSSGMPVTTSKEWRRNTVRLRQIEQLVDRISELENQLKNKAKD